MTLSKPQKVQREKGMSASSGASNMVYCLGMIGAAIYFIQQADTFWQGVLGVLKALIWPAILVYQLLETLSV